MTVPDARADHLATIAQQLAGRIRDEDPNDIARWLRIELPNPSDWFELCFALAAAMPIDVTYKTLTSWIGQPGDPVINQRQAILTADTPAPKKFKPEEHRGQITDLRRRGLTYKQIADQVGCYDQTIARFCRANGLAEAA